MVKYECSYKHANFFSYNQPKKLNKCRFFMSSVIATTAIRGRFLDIQNTVAQSRDIHDQVRLSLIHI